MSIGCLVRNKLCDKNSAIGIVVEIKDNMIIEDDECVAWHYSPIIKVLYSDGTIEINPVELYEVISQFSIEQ